MRKYACCRNCLLLPLFCLLWHHHRPTHHALIMCLPGRGGSTTDFGMEAAKPMALMPTRMLFLTSSGRYHQLAVTLPYVFLPMTQPTTTPHCLSMRRDQPGWRRLPCCPTPSAAAHNSHLTFWLIVLCGGTGSEAPWRPWDNSGRHGRWVHGLLSFS
jgi:hypothetical protein